MKWSLVVLAAVWCGCDPFALGTSGQSIVGGQTDPNDPAVVAIEADGLQYCSGTLIGPHTVLTAGHCANVAGSLVDYEVVFGPDVLSVTETRGVAEQLTHPMYTAEGAAYDLALFRLDNAVTDVAPLALNTVAMSPANVGQNVRHVGYGISDEVFLTGGGVKRTVTYPITQVSGIFVFSGAPGEQTCTGDSGGPGLMVLAGFAESVALVASAGPNCHEAGWDDRVDLVMDWIGSTLAQWEPQPDGGVTDGGGGGGNAIDAGGPGPDAGTRVTPDAGKSGAPNEAGPASNRGGCESGAGGPLAWLVALCLGLGCRFRRVLY